MPRCVGPWLGERGASIHELVRAQLRKERAPPAGPLVRVRYVYRSYDARAGRAHPDGWSLTAIILDHKPVLLPPTHRSLYTLA